MTFRLTSPSFAHEAEIPTKHTCEGADVSPPLVWAGLPAGTKSLALIVDDPDAPDPKAPQRVFVHWVVYDLPPSAKGLAEGASTQLPPSALQGKNDWKVRGYRGPCPPIGRHRYVHKLYALDTVLPDLGEPDKGALERAMEGHVIAQAVLIGTYEKQRAH
ncbi:MAG: YbhB/YbcL family Raf kinase inhibitor-like protein [Polyangiaceae bacterium]|nr:YbhB/YbcL family Raf kinase inhibitor-like protein [Polyangiaceae bacterium]